MLWGTGRVGNKRAITGGIERFCTSRVWELDGSQDTGNWYSNRSPRGQHPSLYLWLLPSQWGACTVLLGRLGQPEPCGEQSRGEGGPRPCQAAAGLSPGCATCAEVALPPRLLKSWVASCRLYLVLGRQA